MAVSLLRVIAGVAKGRKLKAPPGRGTRPATDRLKEAVFSSLGPLVTGAEVLDLYAGSGALGIEALSRGALHATFVEKDEAAVAVIADNLSHIRLSESATLLHMKAEQFAAGPCDRPFQIIFIDPPYALGFPSETLESLAERGHVATGATIVVETSARGEAFDIPPGFVLTGRRRYADSAVAYLKFEGRI